MSPARLSSTRPHRSGASRLLRRSVLALLPAAVLAGCAGPRTPRAPVRRTGPSAAIAVPRSDPNSMLAHQQLLEKRTKGRIDLYFLGNSITRRWGATDYPEFLAHWTQTFFGWNAADFGWGADRLEHILWRIENGELDGVNPKVIVLLAGTNNVGNRAGDDAKIDDIVLGLRTLIERCRQKAPKATIIVMGIFPRNDGVPDKLAVMPEINRINAQIARFADGKRVRYLNINRQLAIGGDTLPPGMTVDGLHPSLQGYQIWADALRPLLTQLLGPRRTTDEAPPPTGDPSAKK